MSKRYPCIIEIYILLYKGRGDHAYSGWRWKNGVKDVGRRCSVGRILRTKKMIKIGSR
jgi:hypothetical protein